MAFYILLSLINLSFVISIIFENQVDLISKNVMLESEKKLSQLIVSMKKFTIEMKKGSLFNVKDDKETLSQFLKIISPHYKDFIIFSDKNLVIYKSSSEINPPDTFKEDGLRAMTVMAFSGKDYYLRVDDDNKIVNFYIPLNEFLPGNLILLVKKNISGLSGSLADLYKQAVYIVFVVFFFHLIFAVILYKEIIHPVNKLGEAADKISTGDLAARVSLTGGNHEFDSLAMTFNRMAESINKNIKSFSTEMKTVKNIQKILEKNEIRDELTGLLNENYMSERIEDELNRVKLKQRDISLILINLDNFSRINELYGNQTGDIILLETAKKIAENCSSGDIKARTGGEEFAVLSPEPSFDTIADLAERIRLSMYKNEVVTPDGKFSMTVSIGISYIKAADLNNFENKNDIVEAARSALARAKSSGKNRVEINS
jgi:diguanylate cyclase (GGDEF)-like protein